MKNSILSIVFFCGIIAAFFSCSSSTSIKIYGEPGTEIYDYDKQLLSTVGDSGFARLTISDDSYDAFLYSKKAGTSAYVPFALDYKENSYAIEHFARALGGTIDVIGSSMILVGGLVYAIDSDPAGAAVLGLGAAAAALGCAMAVPADARLNQTTREYKYKYVYNQNANDDLLITQIVIDTAKTSVPKVIAQEPISQQMAENSQKETTHPSLQSTRSLKDNAAKIEGVYAGTGYLSLTDDVIELFDTINVIITKDSKNTVLVNVTDENDEPFFAEECTYSITRDLQGGYILSLEGSSEATIKIDAENNLTYYHPSVNIEEGIYRLNISAKK